MCPHCKNRLVMSRNNGMQGYRCAHCGYTENLMSGGALDGYTDEEYSEMRRKEINDPKTHPTRRATLIELEDQYSKTRRLGL